MRQPGPAALRGVTAECAADGSVVDVGPALAGHRVVLNLWAYWCAPCAAELPAMAEYQRRVGSDVMVVTVHQDENETAGLLRLAELGVRLPTLQDGSRRVAAALRVPNVMPATVVLDSDGSVAQTLPRAFATCRRDRGCGRSSDRMTPIDDAHAERPGGTRPRAGAGGTATAAGVAVEYREAPVSGGGTPQRLVRMP